MAVVLVVVVLLMPVIAKAIRSINEATRMGTGVHRREVLIINRDSGAPAGSVRRWKAKPVVRGGEVAVLLAAQERAELVQVTKRWFVKASDVARARGLLMAAQSASSATIARVLGTTEATVRAWRREFMAQARECDLESGRKICRRHFADLGVHPAPVVRIGSAAQSGKERG